MLAKRVATALVLLAVLLPTIFVYGPLSWALVTLLIMAFAGWEWQDLRRPYPPVVPGVLVVVLLTALGLAWIWLPAVITAWPVWLEPALFMLAAIYWVVVAPWRLRAHDAKAGGFMLVVLLLIACWVALFSLRQLGPAVLIVALSIVWLADIGAYFIGRAVGRRKLAPSISPGKSWEGAIGGAFLVAVAGSWAAAAPGLETALPARLITQWGPWAGVLVLAALAGLSVLGDLHESLLKRQAQVKDSGWILPGHGGILDRIDALIPTMPVVALLHWVLA